MKREATATMRLKENFLLAKPAASPPTQNMAMQMEKAMEVSERDQWNSASKSVTKMDQA